MEKLNEQLSRMKSLMSEERLYGNLVDPIKDIITEQKGKLLDDILEGVWKAWKKSGVNKIKSKIPGEDVVYRLEDSADGVKVYKKVGGIERQINPKNIADMVSPNVIKGIKGELNQIIEPKDIIKYFDTTSEVNYNKHINSMLSNMVEQGVLSPKVKTQLMNAVNDSNVSGVLKNAFADPKFLTDIKSMDEFVKNYPQTSKYFDLIPGLNDRLFDIKVGGVKNLRSSEFAKMTKLMEEGDTWSNIKKITISGDEAVLEFKNGNTMKYDMSQMTPSEILQIKQLQTQGENWVNLFDGTTGKIKPEFDDLDIKIELPTGKGTKSVSGEKFDMSLDVDEDIALHNRQQLRSFIEPYVEKGFFSKFPYYKKIISEKILSSPKYAKMKEVFLNRYSKAIDIDFLRKNNYNSVGGKNVITDEHETMLNKLFEVKGDPEASIFVTKDESLKLGLEEGSIKPNVVQKTNFDALLEDQFRQHWINSLWKMKPHSQLGKLTPAKSWRNFMLKTGTIGGILSYGIYWYLTVYFWFVEEFIKEFAAFADEKIPFDRRVYLMKKGYIRACAAKVKSVFIQVYGTKDGLFKYNGFVEATGGSIKGSEIDPSTGTVLLPVYLDFTLDEAALQNKEVKVTSYKIDELVGSNISGLGVIKKTNEGTYILETEGDIDNIPIACNENFEDYVAEQQARYEKLKGDPEGELLEIGYDVYQDKGEDMNFYDVMEEIIDGDFTSLKSMAKESVQKAKETATDIDQAAGEVIDKAETKVSGQQTNIDNMDAFKSVGGN